MGITADIIETHMLKCFPAVCPPVVITAGAQAERGERGAALRVGQTDRSSVQGASLSCRVPALEDWSACLDHIKNNKGNISNVNDAAGFGGVKRASLQE